MVRLVVPSEPVVRLVVPSELVVRLVVPSELVVRLVVAQFVKWVRCSCNGIQNNAQL